jgi:soluble cytochrome b562
MFEEEKKSQKPPTKPDIRLNLNKKEDEMPNSIKEAYNVSLNKRRKRGDRSEESKEAKEFNDQFKKLKKNMDNSTHAARKDNHYENLISLDEPEVITAAKLSLSKKDKDNFQSNKITFYMRLEFWENMSTNKARDPLESLESKNKIQTQAQKPKEKFVSYVIDYDLFNHKEKESI